MTDALFAAADGLSAAAWNIAAICTVAILGATIVIAIARPYFSLEASTILVLAASFLFAQERDGVVENVAFVLLAASALLVAGYSVRIRRERTMSALFQQDIEAMRNELHGFLAALDRRSRAVDDAAIRQAQDG